MPGQYAMRGGILDVYSPEADRPLRIEFFGDEAESIRKFDPASQRSSNPVDEALLLPLTETPSANNCSAQFTRGSAASESPATKKSSKPPSAPVESSFSRLGVLRSRRRSRSAPSSISFRAPRFCSTRPINSHRNSTASGPASPKPTSAAASAIWSAPKISICRPDDWWQKTAALPGADIEHLGITRSLRRRLRRHISHPALAPLPRRGSRHARGSAEAQRRWQARALRRAEHRRSRASGRCLHRIQRLVSASEAAPAAAKATPTKPATSPAKFSPLRSPQPTSPMACCFPKPISPSSARAICSTNPNPSPRARSAQKSKVSAFLSDFRDLQVGDYVVHVEHGIGQYQGLKEINHGDGPAEFMLLEFAEAARLYVPLTRLDLVQKYRSSEGAKPALESSRHAGLVEDESPRAQGHERHGGRTSQALRRAQNGRRDTRFRRATSGSANLKTPSNSTRPKTRPRPSKT